MDAYVALEVCRDATPSELLDAYRRLSLLHHPHRSISTHTNRSTCSAAITTTSPERNKNYKNQYNNDFNNITMEEEYRVFELLSQCYETLSDDMTRRRYDFLFNSIQKKKEQEQYASLLCCHALEPVEDIFGDNNDDDEYDDDLYANTSQNEAAIHVTSDVRCPYIRAMHRARDFKPFTDPFQLFVKVHGSDIFNHSKADSCTVSENNNNDNKHNYGTSYHHQSDCNTAGNSAASSSISIGGGTNNIEANGRASAQQKSKQQSPNYNSGNHKSLSRLRDMLGRPRKGLKRAWILSAAACSPIAACTDAQTMMKNSVDDSAVSTVPLSSDYFSKAAAASLHGSGCAEPKTTTVYVADPDNPDVPPTVIRTTMRVINGKIMRRTETTVSIPQHQQQEASNGDDDDDDSVAVTTSFRKETTVEVTSEEIDLYHMMDASDGDGDEDNCCNEQCDTSSDIAGRGTCGGGDRSLKEILESCSLCTGCCTGAASSGGGGGASVHNVAGIY